MFCMNVCNMNGLSTNTVHISSITLQTLARTALDAVVNDPSFFYCFVYSLANNHCRYDHTLISNMVN